MHVCHYFVYNIGIRKSPTYFTITAMVGTETYQAILFNFLPLQIVSRYRNLQLQVGGNYSYLFNLRPNICKTENVKQKDSFNSPQQ